MRIKKCLVLFFCISLTLSVMVQYCTAADDDDNDGVDVEVEDEDTKVEKPKFVPPVLKGSAHLSESFNKKDDFKRWIVSEAKKDGAEESISKYDGKWVVEEPRDSAVEGDLGLILKSKAKHHAVSRKLDRPFRFDGKPLVVQYEVRYQDGVDCGGAYIKLLSEEAKPNLKNFHDKTPYTIMFGPDKCGMDHKIHFIFRHKNPKTGELEEKHAKKPSGNIDKNFSDKKTHLYTLVVSPDNTFEVLVDNSVVNEGTLLDDFSPPVNPPKEIDDPDDKKPEDYDEREKIPDPDAVKPDDWDESEPEKIENQDAIKPEGWLDDEEKLVPDPDAEKPVDWDDDMDGEWEAPLIENAKCKEAPGCGTWERPMMDNPKYKGKWRPAMIDNPDYKGVWKPRRIPNPNYFEDSEPYKMTPITAVGLELWSMNDEVVFDNFIVTNDKGVAEAWATETWEVKFNAEKAASSSGRSVIDAITDATKDKPWLWAVILVVVVLPIVLIVAYCCMSKTEKGFFNTLKAAADERPWMWALYVVILLLPVLLISICVCPRGGPIKPDQLGERKKTDAVSPDDQPAEEENAESKDESNDEKSEENESKVGADGDNPGSVKKSKASLEAEEENDDEDDDDEENIEENKGNESPRRSPRKRRSRKE